MNFIFALYCMLGLIWLFHGKCTAAPEFIGPVHRQQNRNRAFLRGGIWHNFYVRAAFERYQNDKSALGRKNRLIDCRYAIDNTYGGDDDILDLNKRQQFDDYGHMRFGKRDRFDDYGHM